VWGPRLRSRRHTAVAWYDVCSRTEVPPDGGRPVDVGGRPIAVFDDRGVLRAVDNVCRHLGSPLDGGWVERGCVTCPFHGWRYDLATGEVVTLFGRSRGLRTYRVRVAGGRVLVEVTDEEDG